MPRSADSPHGIINDHSVRFLEQIG